MADNPFSPAVAKGAPPVKAGTGEGGWTVRSRVSQALLLAALGFFVAFHFLPTSGRNRGWRIWRDSFEMAFTDPALIPPHIRMICACFLGFSLLIVISPFLKSVREKSRWARWGTLIFSGVTSVIFVGICLKAGSGGVPDAAAGCLLLAPVLNFIGLGLAPSMRDVSPEGGD